MSEMRLPRPVFSYPNANINAIKISQTVVFENPDKPQAIAFADVTSSEAFNGGPILNIHAITTPKRAIYDEGKGSSINPINTLTKREKKIQPS